MAVRGVQLVPPPLHPYHLQLAKELTLPFISYNTFLGSTAELSLFMGVCGGGGRWEICFCPSQPPSCSPWENGPVSSLGSTVELLLLTGYQ